MRKDPLQKEIHKEIRKFRRKRRWLGLQIFFHQQKLNMVRFFATSEMNVLRTKYRIKELLADTKNLEDQLREEAFYRFFMREEDLG